MKLATHMAVAMEMHGAYTCSLTRDLEAHHASEKWWPTS